MTPSPPERIFHIATAADWRRTLESGTYTTSTIGRSLEEEGFIHASRRDQVQGVFDRYYRGAGEHLVLLTIDPSRLTDAEVRVEPVGDDTYPHVYGPIDRGAVVEVTPLDRRGRSETLMSLWDRERRPLRADGDGLDRRSRPRATGSHARIKSGTVGINMPYTAFPGIPFGGYKQSGFGRELGVDTLELYLETKSVIVNTSPKPINPFGL